MGPLCLSTSSPLALGNAEGESYDDMLVSLISAYGHEN